MSTLILPYSNSTICFVVQKYIMPKTSIKTSTKLNLIMLAKKLPHHETIQITQMHTTNSQIQIQTRIRSINLMMPITIRVRKSIPMPIAHMIINATSTINVRRTTPSITILFHPSQMTIIALTLLTNYRKYVPNNARGGKFHQPASGNRLNKVSTPYRIGHELDRTKHSQIYSREIWY